LLLITFAMARSTSTVATRSPSQSHCIIVVGTAHTCSQLCSSGRRHGEGGEIRQRARSAAGINPC
jgi:hypothetical protein